MKSLLVLMRAVRSPKFISGLLKTTSEPALVFLGRRRQIEQIPSLEGQNSILIVRTDQIGDFILTTSLLRELRRVKPNAYMALVVSPESYQLAETCPYVDEVLKYDPMPAKDSTANSATVFLKRHFMAIRLCIKRLWKKRFDLALVPRWDTDYHNAVFVSYMSGARNRIGFSENVNARKSIYNRGYDRLLSSVIDDRNILHEGLRGMQMLQYLGVKPVDSSVEIWLKESDREFAAKIMNSLGKRKIRIAFVAGALSGRRRWPIDNYCEVASWAIRDLDAEVVLLGGPEETGLSNLFEKSLHGECLNLCGKTTLRQAAAVIESCSLLLCNDSSAGHIAASVHTRVIVLSCHPAGGDPAAVNSPVRFSPLSRDALVIQPKNLLAPCKTECLQDFAHCITGIKVEEVKKAVIEFGIRNETSAECHYTGYEASGEYGRN